MSAYTPLFSPSLQCYKYKLYNILTFKIDAFLLSCEEAKGFAIVFNHNYGKG
jgi:hypothetical protein